MFSLAPSEWEENFQDLSGWCLPTTNMAKQQCIADPAELNTPVIELGSDELQLNISVSKTETNSEQDTEELIVDEWPSLDEPSFMNMLLPKSDSLLIGVESVDSLGSEDLESYDKNEDKIENFLGSSDLVSLKEWECNLIDTNTSKLEVQVDTAHNDQTKVLTSKPKLKLKIPANFLLNDNELSTPNIVKMLVDSPEPSTVNMKKSSCLLPLDLSPLDGPDDFLQPLDEQSGGFDLLAYVFEDTSKSSLSSLNLGTKKKTVAKEDEGTDRGKISSKSKLVSRPCGKPKSISWNTNDGEKPCSSKQREIRSQNNPAHFSMPVSTQIKREEFSDEDEIICSTTQPRKRKAEKTTHTQRSETPSKRSYRSSSSSSTQSEIPLDVKYRELRDRNNEASKRSRQNRKVRDGEMKREALRLEKENRSLKIKAEEMERLVKQLRESLLKTIANRK